MEKTAFSAKLGKFFMSFFFLFIVWLMFTSSLNIQEVVTGLIASLIIAFFTSHFFDCCPVSILSPVRLFWAVVYLFVFLTELVKANLDVARRILTPALPINPGIVKFKTRLQSEYAKMVLANSITLTPGTLTVDLLGDTLYIHWIDVKTLDPEQAHKEIAEKFENILLKIF